MTLSVTWLMTVAKVWLLLDRDFETGTDTCEIVWLLRIDIHVPSDSLSRLMASWIGTRILPARLNWYVLALMAYPPGGRGNLAWPARLTGLWWLSWCVWLGRRTLGSPFQFSCAMSTFWLEMLKQCLSVLAQALTIFEPWLSHITAERQRMRSKRQNKLQSNLDMITGERLFQDGKDRRISCVKIIIFVIHIW